MRLGQRRDAKPGEWLPDGRTDTIVCTSTSFILRSFPSHSFRNILDDAERPAIIVDSISETTFKLSDGIILPSNAVFLNGTAFMWDVPPPAFDWPGWTQEMFEVFEVVAPKPGKPDEKAIARSASYLD